MRPTKRHLSGAAIRTQRRIARIPLLKPTGEWLQGVHGDGVAAAPCDNEGSTESERETDP